MRMKQERFGMKQPDKGHCFRQFRHVSLSGCMELCVHAEVKRYIVFLFMKHSLAKGAL